jgi:hypothetical protein
MRVTNINKILPIIQRQLSKSLKKLKKSSTLKSGGLRKQALF